MRHISKMILTFVLIFSFAFQFVIQSEASTVYISNGAVYEEGYIIIGESHVVNTCIAFQKHTDDNNHVKGLNSIDFCLTINDSLGIDDVGNDDTFIMTGNLFFVFEGNKVEEGLTQIDKEYIYSDGAGNQGIAVKKIHEIINTNSNIKHWNIISYQGAVSALDGSEGARYYIDSYKNWITKEFPNSSVYFVSHSTLTKFYKQNRDAYKFDTAIRDAFPENYIDMTDFYKSIYPQKMLNPDQNPDNIHWSFEAYIEIFSEVINRIQMNSNKKELFQTQEISVQKIVSGKPEISELEKVELMKKSLYVKVLEPAYLISMRKCLFPSDLF